MNRRDVLDLLEMIRRYIDEGERTKVLAAEIEGLVLECFQDEPWFDDLSEALALFVPGGSSPYIDEAALARELAAVEAELNRSLHVGSDEG